MLKKFLISLFVFIISLYTTICYATSVPVTDENLNNSLQKFVSSDSNDKNYKISVANKIITITSSDGNYTLNYDLTNNPTFSYEVDIKQGMSYADFKEQTDNLMLPMIGYIAVANIQGVEIEDASTYFLMSYLSNAINGSWSTENSYVIVDDTNMLDGVTIVKDESDSKTIYASEFGERVMEYVNATYKDKQTIKDSSDGINSYEWTTERKDVAETSCKLVSSLSVNLDADFSKLNDYSNQVADSALNKNITEENADYVIKLKVGQKCKIESNEKITGYETSGSSCIEFSEDCTIITATAVGKANGYIYVGNNNIKKSIYVIVEENTENKTLDTITITINTTSGTANTDTQKITTIKTDTTENKQTATTTENNTTSKTILPQTGTNEIIGISIISVFAVLSIIFGIKNKKYKDIK